MVARWLSRERDCKARASPRLDLATVRMVGRWGGRAHAVRFLLALRRLGAERGLSQREPALDRRKRANQAKEA